MVEMVKAIQAKTYAMEIITLMKVSTNPLSSQFCLFLDDNKLLRLGGRLHNAPMTFQAKFPIILPHLHPFTTLMDKLCIQVCSQQ